MADDERSSSKKEKKERGEHEKKEKKEKKEKEKASSGKHTFLGISNPFTHRKDATKTTDPHNSYHTDPASPAAGDVSRDRNASNSSSNNKFGSTRARSMVIGADATASPGFSSKAAAAASPTATPSPGGDPPSPAKMSTNATLAAPPVAQNGELTPAEVILDTENIEPVPGPLDDPDFPKQKPGETLVNRLKVQGTNIALLIFCVLLSWCIGALGMSFVWTILLVIALHKTDWKIKKEGWITYYRAQERKRMFQEMQTSDFEKMVWLRILLNKAWPTYANYMITTTRVQTAKAVEEMFAKNKPPGVDNVVLDHVDFGTIAPDILSMKGYTSYETRDGKHVDDNTHFQVDTNVAYKGDFTLRAKVYVRVAPFAPAVPLPITINGITFEGRARCIITLLPQQPFVEQVEVAMVTMPKVGFKVTPLGALDVMSISALESMVQVTIDDVMKSMFVLPNRFIYRMPGAPPASEVHNGATSRATAETGIKLGKQTTKTNFVKPAVRRTLGTLKVEAVEARNLKAMDANGKSDPFLKLKVGSIKKKTKIIEKTLDPKWNESFEFTVTNEYPKELFFACYDYDKGFNSNDLIGEATYDFSDLAPEHLKDSWFSFGPQLGDIRLRLIWYPDPTA